MDRVETLKQLLAQNPSDSFARYGLAMEYARTERLPEAVAQYQAIIAADPNYTAAYYQGGKALERLGRTDEAREFYRRGVEVAAKLGNGHARDEMQAALDELG